MSPFTSIDDAAREASAESGNKNMLAHGRTEWNKDDFQAAYNVYELLRWQHGRILDRIDLERV